MRTSLRRPAVAFLVGALAGVLAPDLLAVSTGVDRVSARDQHFLAVRSLIDRQLLVPAERQKQEFLDAGYPDARWCATTLDWFYADRFRTVDARLIARADELGRALLAQEAADPLVLPQVVRDLRRGVGSRLLRLVNELGAIIDPNLPAPVLGRDAPAAEREHRQLLVRAVCEQAAQDFALAAGRVAAFERDQEPLLDTLPPNDPRVQKIGFEAASLRFEAVRVLFQAHLVLREVITRGGDFAIDAASAQAFMRDLLAKNLSQLNAWEYVWGDRYLPLKTVADILLAEAVRQKLPGIEAAEVESSLYQVVDTDLRSFPAEVRPQLIEHQLTAWASLMRWRLELGTDQDIARGLETWTQLKERLGSGLPVRLDADEHRSKQLAECSILAARLFVGRHDGESARVLLAEVASAARNPLAANAKSWLLALKPDPQCGAWSDPPVPGDPEKLLAIASVFLQQAEATAEPR